LRRYIMNGDVAIVLWPLLLVNTAIFLVGAIGFHRSRQKRGWRSSVAAVLFAGAMLIEVYGIPVYILLVSSWIQSHARDVDFVTRNAAQLWRLVFALPEGTLLTSLRVVGGVLLAIGLGVLALSWHELRSTPAHK
jgi:hypothetical protein